MTRPLVCARFREKVMIIHDQISTRVPVPVFLCVERQVIISDKPPPITTKSTWWDLIRLQSRTLTTVSGSQSQESKREM